MLALKCIGFHITFKLEQNSYNYHLIPQWRKLCQELNNTLKKLNEQIALLPAPHIVQLLHHPRHIISYAIKPKSYKIFTIMEKA